MEIWKEIKDYEGLYEISNLGKVRTITGKVTYTKRFSKNIAKVWQQRILKTRIDQNSNSERVDLIKNKIRKTYNMGRIVAYTFYNQDYNDHSKTVNHIDGNRLNNKLENLEIITQKENQKHAYINGLSPTKKILIKDITTNTIYEFASLALANRYFNKNSYFMGYRIKTNNLIFDNYEIIKGGNNENLETKRVSYFFRD
jgi:hypothetical protein